MKNSIAKDEQASLGELMKAVLIGTLIGLGTALTLMLILSGAAMLTADPDRWIGPMAAVARLVGAFLCGLAGRMADRQRCPMTGAVSGALYVLLFWLASLFFKDAASAMAPYTQALWYGGCVILSLLGGFTRKGKPRYSEAHSPTAAARRQLARK